MESLIKCVLQQQTTDEISLIYLNCMTYYKNKNKNPKSGHIEVKSNGS